LNSLSKKLAQSFPVSSPYHISHLALKLYRHGSDEDEDIYIYAEIQGLDENGHPDGTQLAYGYMYFNDLTEDTNGKWYYFDLDPGYDLLSDGPTVAKYAIVLYGNSYGIPLDTNNYVCWMADGTFPVYPYGAALVYVSSWVAGPNDFMFRCYTNITEDGIYEYAFDASAIYTEKGEELTAAAHRLLLRYAPEMKTGSFKSRRRGWKAGQYFNIYSTRFGNPRVVLDEVMFVTSVDKKVLRYDLIEYTINFSSIPLGV
jgi:hypothetical protein